MDDHKSHADITQQYEQLRRAERAEWSALLEAHQTRYKAVYTALALRCGEETGHSFKAILERPEHNKGTWSGNCHWCNAFYYRGIQ